MFSQELTSDRLLIVESWPSRPQSSLQRLAYFQVSRVDVEFLKFHQAVFTVRMIVQFYFDPHYYEEVAQCQLRDIKQLMLLMSYETNVCCPHFAFTIFICSIFVGTQVLHHIPSNMYHDAFKCCLL